MCTFPSRFNFHSSCDSVVLISLMRQQIDDSRGKLNFELQNWASFLRKPVAINLLEIPVLRRPVSY